MAWNLTALLVAILAALGLAAVAYGLGTALERRRWWPLRFAARRAVGRESSRPEGTPPRVPEDLLQLSRALMETVTRLELYRERTRRDLAAMRAALDGLDEGVVVLDPLGRVIEANRPARDVWGPLFPTVAGRDSILLFREAALDEAVASVRRDGQPKDLEHVHGASQRVFHVTIRSLQMEDEAQQAERGSAPSVIVILRDITNVRATERMRRDFVANASHELRTPLTAIQGYAEALADDRLDPDTRHRYVRRTVQNAEVMAGILEDMLRLSRVESLETPFRLEPLDLADEARAACDRMMSLFAERSLRLTTDLGGALAVGDPGQLQQAIGNLLSNAARYTPAGGGVTVRTDTVDRDGRCWARLLVEDTGAGVPEPDRERIFERFYRVDKGRGRDTGGTGLGLAIVKHIVLRHDGRVWVEPRDGGGSRFVMLLPAHHTAVHPARPVRE